MPNNVAWWMDQWYDQLRMPYGRRANDKVKDEVKEVKCMKDKGLGGGVSRAEIYLAGPCNRRCVFCAGRSSALAHWDGWNTLGSWPLPGMEELLKQMKLTGVNQLTVSGVNTDPLLYGHLDILVKFFRNGIEGLVVEIVSNGVGVLDNLDWWLLFDKARIICPSFDAGIYEEVMGRGLPPDIKKIVKCSGSMRGNICVDVPLCDGVQKGLVKYVENLGECGIGEVLVFWPGGKVYGNLNNGFDSYGDDDFCFLGYGSKKVGDYFVLKNCSVKIRVKKIRDEKVLGLWPDGRVEEGVFVGSEGFVKEHRDRQWVSFIQPGPKVVGSGVVKSFDKKGLAGLYEGVV